MRDFKMLVIGMLFGLLLSFVFGFKSNETIFGRYQAVVVPQGLLTLNIVDTTTGETKIVTGKGVGAQYGVPFNDMVNVPKRN